MIYISGKITADDPKEMRRNLARFYEVEELLEKEYKDVVNPARFEEMGKTWEQYLARDLAFINKYKPELYMMKNWEESRGARLEFETAKHLKLNIIYEV